MSQPLYTGGAPAGPEPHSQSPTEKLDQLSEELTRDQIHYQSDAFYWNASSARAMLNASAQYQEIVEKQYEIIQHGFKDGAISRTDLLMISTRRKEAELQYINARRELYAGFAKA